MKSHKRLVRETKTVCVLSLCVASFSDAFGQEPDPEDDARRLEEILVTAQRREARLQDTPLTVTALSPDALEINRIGEMIDVANFTPGFNVSMVSPDNPLLVMRGIGTSTAGGDLGVEESVVVYVDDVPILRGGGTNINLFDLERVEVLKGPQGTLFGRNVVGGAIRLVTRKPDDQTYIKAEATVGDFDLIETRGVISEPVSDNIFAKVAWSTKNRDGFNINRVTGNRTDDANQANVRGQILIVPSQNLDILFSGDFSTDKINGIHRTVLPGGLTARAGFVPDPNLRIGAVNATEVEGFASLDGFIDREQAGASAHINWETPIGTVNTITSLRTLDFSMSRDFGTIPLSETPSVCPAGEGVCEVKSVLNSAEDGETFTNEVRLSSVTAVGGRELDWTVGTFFVHEDVDRTQIRDREVFGTQSLPAFIQAIETNGVAVFGHAAYAITDRMKFTYGIRWSRDNKTFDLEVLDFSGGERDALPPAAEEFTVDGLEETFSEITTDITLDYAVTDDHFVFLTARRGFKSGGFNGFAADERGARIVADPETAWNYELGFKTEWFNHALRLNTSLFWIEFDDLQLTQQVEVVPGDVSTRTVALVNAAEARIRGIETELDFAPTDWLRLRASHAFLDTEVVDFVIPSVFGFVEGGAVLTGNELPRAPENSFVVSADLNFPVRNGGHLRLFASYRYESAKFDDPTNVPISRIDDFGIVDSRVSFETPGRRWKLSAWVQNLNDELTPATITPVGGAGLTTVNDDRIYGLTAQYNY